MECCSVGSGCEEPLTPSNMLLPEDAQQSLQAVLQSCRVATTERRVNPVAPGPRDPEPHTQLACKRVGAKGRCMLAGEPLHRLQGFPGWCHSHVTPRALVLMHSKCGCASWLVLGGLAWRSCSRASQLSCAGGSGLLAKPG